MLGRVWVQEGFWVGGGDRVVYVRGVIIYIRDFDSNGMMHIRVFYYSEVRAKASYTVKLTIQ